MTFLYIHTAGPSGPPVEFSVESTDPHTLLFSWEEVPLEQQNGNITAYTLSCQPDVVTLPATYSLSGRYSINGFSPATVYNCSVYASTAGGSGPSVVRFVATQHDGTYTYVLFWFCLKAILLPLLQCQDQWQISLSSKLLLLSYK